MSFAQGGGAGGRGCYNCKLRPARIFFSKDLLNFVSRSLSTFEIRHDHSVARRHEYGSDTEPYFHLDSDSCHVTFLLRATDNPYVSGPPFLETTTLIFVFVCLCWAHLRDFC